MCSKCESDRREVWGPSNPGLVLEIVEGGSWVNLEQCPECKTMWVHSDYEPYSSFPYYVKWMYSTQAWRDVHDVDSGKTMHKWLANQIKLLWHNLPTNEIEVVEKHRNRTYGQYNPIDKPFEEVHIEDIIKTSENKT